METYTIKGQQGKVHNRYYVCMAGNKYIYLCVAMLFFTVHSFGQGNYLGYQLKCANIVGDQIINCLKEVIGEQRYAELLKVEQKKWGYLKIEIDSLGRVATYTIYDEHSLLTEKEKQELSKKITATCFDFCTGDWYFREITKEQLFKPPYNNYGTKQFSTFFPYIPLDER